MLKSKLKLKTDELRNLKQPESLKATRLVRLYGGRKLCWVVTQVEFVYMCQITTSIRPSHRAA